MIIVMTQLFMTSDTKRTKRLQRDWKGKWTRYIHDLHLCEDCELNVFEMREYYMIHDMVWGSVVRQEHQHILLCIGCIEARLGRTLTPADFTFCGVNVCANKKSMRLLDRMGNKLDVPLTESELLEELSCYIQIYPHMNLAKTLEKNRGLTYREMIDANGFQLNHVV